MKAQTATLLVASLALFTTSHASAVIVDGSITGEGYGSPLSVQTIQTQFGDNLSELNAAYAQIENGTLYLAITGNLESNFNKLNIYIDSVAGGQNNIDPAANPANWDSLGPGWAPLDGLTFDAGFEADYAFLARRGSGKFDFDYAQLGQTAIDADEFVDAFLGFDEGPSGPIVGNGAQASPGNGSGFTFEVGYDNSNTAGVMGGTLLADTAAAAAAETGFEFAIPLAAIGNPTGPIKVTAFVNNGNQDFLSNQFLAPLEVEDFDGDPVEPDRPNLGGFMDISVLPGQQFFTIPNGVLVGDTDGDGDIDDFDLLNAISNFTGSLAAGTGGKGIPDGDTDADADVDDFDLLNMISGFTGSLSAPSSPSVPEPTSVALLSLGGLALLRRRRSS